MKLITYTSFLLLLFILSAKNPAFILYDDGTWEKVESNAVKEQKTNDSAKILDLTDKSIAQEISSKAVDFEALNMAKGGPKNKVTIFRNKDSLEPFSGWIRGVKEGQLQALVKVSEGKVNGPYVTWNSGGGLKYYYHGSEHFRDGLNRRWNDEGVLTWEYNYSNGYYDGTCKDFEDDGTLTMVSNYKEGRLMQRIIYLPNGEESDEGAVINGRGESKGCLYDDGYIVSGYKDENGEWVFSNNKMKSPAKPAYVF